MSRQAAQRTLAHHYALPIDARCAKFPDFPELREMSAACDRWLRKRGLIEPDNFCYGAMNRQKPNNQTNTTNETTLL